MVQIGELAALAGVTTRTIRYYHRIGLLPEPARSANGYRVYGAKALSRLVQIRRLSSLGLTLSEVADALDAESEVDLPEVLRELDTELAAREAEIRQRRAVIARLIEHGDDPTLSPELARAVRELGLSQAEIDPLRAAEVALPEMVEPYRAGVAPDPAWRACEALFNELDDSGADDPRVETLARRMYAMLPELLPEAEPGDIRPPSAEMFRFGHMMIADLSDGQRRVMELLMEYGRADTPQRD